MHFIVLNIAANLFPIQAVLVFEDRINDIMLVKRRLYNDDANVATTGRTNQT